MNKKNRKKQQALCIASVLVCALAGCGKEAVRQPYTEEDMMVVPKEADASDVLTLTMVGSDNWVRALKEEFPDIHFETEYYNGANPSGYLKEHLLHENAVPDLYISSFWPDGELQKKVLLDLSVYDYTERFRPSFINDCNVDGSIYMLPVSFQVTSYAYNKTLFAEHGWEVPKNNEELVALVKQIRREAPELIPISVPAKLAGYGVQYFTGFSQCGFLKTPAGVDWEQRFLSGSAKAEEGFGEGAKELQRLIDAGAFDASMKDAGALDTMGQLVERKAAIAYYMSSFNVLEEGIKTTEDEFGAFPFFGAGDEAQAVSVIIPRYLGLGKQLEHLENEGKLKNAQRVIDWMTTEKGLSNLTAAFSNSMTPLKDGAAKARSPLWQDIDKQVEKGYTMSATAAYSIFQDITVPCGWALCDALMGKCTVADAMKVIDEAKAEARENGGAMVLGEVAERMSNEEAAQFTANLYLDTGLGEIALVYAVPADYHGEISGKNGVSGRMFEGVVTNENCTINVPFNKKFVTLTMTGKQIRELLEEGVTIASDTGENVRYEYFCAGLDTERENGKIEEMRYQEKPVKDEDTFTVIMNQDGWQEGMPEEKNIQITVHEEFENTTEYFMEWLEERKGTAIERPEVLNR